MMFKLQLTQVEVLDHDFFKIKCRFNPNETPYIIYDYKAIDYNTTT